MIDRNEIVLSTHDAATLSAVLATFSSREAPQGGAAEELAEILAGARLVAHHAIEGDIVALDTEVTYVELPNGATPRKHMVKSPSTRPRLSGAETACR